jgi:hypothetical protein
MSGIASERKSRFSLRKSRSHTVNGDFACSESDCHAVNGANSAAAGWAASPRATNYRPFKKVEGVDADYVALELTSETQVLLENVPAKAVVHLQVTAHNAAGESAKSAVATITLT